MRLVLTPPRLRSACRRGTSAHSSDLELLTQFGKNARLELSHMLINISAHRSPTPRQLSSGAALVILTAR